MAEHPQGAVRALAEATPPEIPALLPGILNFVRLIWSCSTHYGTDNRISGLLKKISNEIIRRCQATIELADIFEGKIDGIAINQFWQVPEGFWPVILLFIAVPETFRALRGWMEPTVPENYFQLRTGYVPGDLDFDPLGLKPEDPEELKEMQTKELQHGRLAMLAAAGMIVQELQTGAMLF